jgi:DNA-binding SARP family transcriptional activator
MRRAAAGGPVPPGARDAPRGLFLHTYGGFCLCRAGRPVPVSAWRRRAGRELLVRLLLAKRRPVGKAELRAALWPEAGEAEAANRLRVTLHALRRVLEPGLPAGRPSAFLTVGRSDCALSAGPELLGWDVERVAAALAAAAAAPDGAGARAPLASALPLLRGAWLPDLDGGPDLAAARWHCQRLGLDLALRLGELALQQGDQGQAVAAAAAALGLEPSSEAGFAILLRAAERQGTSALVRRAYDLCRAELARHCDADPSPWLRGLCRAALSGAGRPLAGA